MNNPNNKIDFSTPNILTLFRIALLPVLLVFYWIPFTGHFYMSAFVFAIITFTDWLDGFLARRMKLISEFGQFLDPLADKIVISVILVMLTFFYQNLIITLCSMIIIAREIIVSGQREWMARIGKSSEVKVNIFGKLKTSSQMLAIFLLLLDQPNSMFALAGQVCLLLATVATLYSGWIYSKQFFKQLMDERSNSNQN